MKALLGFVSLLVAAGPAPGHHSITPYDLIHGTIIEGAVTSFRWENPHAHLLLDVTGENYVVEHWSVELESPNVLGRLGWTKDTLKPKDRVVVTGGRAKNGSFNLRAVSVQLPDGRKLPALPPPEN